MCSINVVVCGTRNNLDKMGKATERRGLKRFTSDYGGVIVDFNHLPTTENDFKNGYETKNYHVWLNGYISNYKELASKYSLNLESERDTEVLAKLIELNIDFSELNGFFAIAIYNKNTGLISFMTDRYGIKQLYKYEDNGVTYVSSELKGILSVFPNLELENEAIEDWRYSLGVMTENTIYKGITRVEKLQIPNIQRSKNTSDIFYEECKIKLYELWNKSIQRNKYNGYDGVYLSGGIDSGIIANHIKAKYSFSIDYVESKFSEIELIKKNSKGNHITYIMNDEAIREYADKTLMALDDLKAGSCYTNFAISKLASNFCRVVYSGAGGDEFFGGYPHRLKKTVSEVIRRNYNLPLKYYNISHYEYDLKFLQSVLIVEDRMSGFHTMETRYPLLDNDLVNFALSLPLEFLENKRILKDISGLQIDVLQGEKKGFSNPNFTNNEWAEFMLNNIK